MKNVEISLKKFSLKKGYITCLALLLGLSVIEVSSLYAAEKQDRTRTAKEVQACKSNQNENSLEIYREFDYTGHDSYFRYYIDGKTRGKNGVYGTITGVKAGLDNTKFTVNYSDFYNYVATGEIQKNSNQWLEYAIKEYQMAKQKNKINAFVLPSQVIEKKCYYYGDHDKYCYDGAYYSDLADGENAYRMYKDTIKMHYKHPTTFTSQELTSLKKIDVPIIFYSGEYGYLHDYHMMFKKITNSTNSFKPSAHDQISNTQLNTYLKNHKLENAYTIEVNKDAKIIPGMAEIYMRAENLSNGNYNLYNYDPKTNGISYAGRAVEKDNVLTFKTNQKGFFFLTKEKTATATVKGYSGTYDAKAHGITLSGYPTDSSIHYRTSPSGVWTTKKPLRASAGTTKVYYKIEHPNYKAITGSANITVKSVSLLSATVATIPNKTYTGGQIKPSVTVKLGKTTLKEGKDYKLSYTKNTAVGKATIQITGIGNYTGSIKKSFTIVKKNISGLSYSGLTTRSYTGKRMNPAVVIKYGKTTLKRGKDYTVKYGKNTSVGKGTVQITGKGNYAGTVVKNFNIVPKAPSVSVKAAKGKLQVSMKAVGASGYQIAYATSSKGKWNYTMSGSSKTIKLSRNKTYYVKVRAYKTIDGKKCYGSYSSLKHVKTK